MAWDDIDFNLIVPGMITAGPAAVSFADYLNEFSIALDERWNIVDQTTNTPPTLFDIQFEKGEIRKPGANDFWVKLRDLIEGYNQLWFDHVYYEEGVLTDVLNDPDYIISDSDLEVAIGSEAYDILVNYEDLSNQDIFKASIFQAFYIIYQKTQFVKKTSFISSNDNTYYNRPVTYRSSLIYKWPFVTLDPPEYSTYSGMTSAYTAASAPVISTHGGGSIFTTLYNTKSQIAEWDSVEAEGYWMLNDTSAEDYVEISYLSKDLLGDILTMSVYPASINVFINYIKDTTSGSVDERAYTDKYDYTFFSSVPNVFHEDDYSFSQDVSLGTVMHCAFGDDPSSIAPALATPDDTSTPSGPTEEGQLQQQFRLDKLQQIYVDLNNPDLEFYIPPPP